MVTKSDQVDFIESIRLFIISMASNMLLVPTWERYFILKAKETINSGGKISWRLKAIYRATKTQSSEMFYRYKMLH